MHPLQQTRDGSLSEVQTTRGYILTEHRVRYVETDHSFDPLIIILSIDLADSLRASQYDDHQRTSH